MTKDIQLSILRATGRYVRKMLEPINKALSDLQTRALVPGPKGEKGDPGQNGADGARGADGSAGANGIDGKSITLDDVLPVLKSMQAEWALDFERRAQALFQKAVDAIPKPKDGRDGLDGIGWDDMVVEHDGKRTTTLKWLKGDVEHSANIVIPSVIDIGFWKDGMHAEKGDGVTFGGSYWIAQEETDKKPGIGVPEWRLAVRKGRDGAR